MTTIACDLEEMATDSLATVNDIRIARKQKLYRINGDLVACAGRTGDAANFREWYANGGEKPGVDDEFAALVLTKEGIGWYDATCTKIAIDDAICAVGSGADLARGAMMAGASPGRAVEIACEYDVGSGPPVVAERL